MLNDEVRLQKLLSAITSRRKAETLISVGRITVNGTVATLGAKASPSRDQICLDGQPIAQKNEHHYIMLHKPERVVSTTSDPQNRKTVLDFLPPDLRCFPVGRLDYNTSGLLLLTTDGDFAYRITHPSHEIKKTYIARVNGIPNDTALRALRTGILINNIPTAPCEVTLTKKEPNAQLRITIHEGRNRQVRKMCEAVGCPVISLKRVTIGDVQLGNLPVGKWKAFTTQPI
jgi:23S rRNA pseudouridine2605 synthase